MKTRFFSIAALMALMMWSLPAMASSLRGDVNNDDMVDINDVTDLISHVLGNAVVPNQASADVNNDHLIDINDVTMLIDHVLGKDVFPHDDVLEDEEFTVNGVTFTMVAVEGGSFMMGATPEQGSDPSDRERPVHLVTLTDYHIGQTEVTQALWLAVMGDNPSYFALSGDQYPVENVSWEDCQAFIAQLNRLTGRTFSLPTEAQWEFAARGGNESMGYKYAGSNDVGNVAWYSLNDSWQFNGTGAYGTHAVATRVGNELMTYDMSGNVHEWCNDWYGPYDSADQTDPQGPATGTARVYRGGSWYFDQWFCRVSFRNSVAPSYRSYGIGLRLAL